MKMTLCEFNQTFQQAILDNPKWKRYPSPEIRFVHVDGYEANPYIFCPITALGFEVTKQCYQLAYAHTVGLVDLHLEVKDIMYLIALADNDLKMIESLRCAYKFDF